MKDRSCYNPPAARATKHLKKRARVHTFAAAWLVTALFAAALLAFVCAPRVYASSDAPQWMHALVNVPLPPHDEKTDAVLLYSEEILNVQANGKIKTTERRAYKILRPGGREHGTVYASFDAETRITAIHGWCIPAQGKDYEVKDKDVIETALFGVEDGELASDARTKVLKIPAPDPGNIVGYEIEHEDRPYVLQDEWPFQEEDPVRESRYTLQLPPGWEYKATFLNYTPVKEASIGNNQWQWVVTNVDAVRTERQMPAWPSVAGLMVVSFFAPGGAQTKGFDNWNDMALWEAGLVRGRRDSSAEIKQKVAALTANETDITKKMAALAKFVQDDIRYVAIELGIGGFQPHAAADVFSHHFGDCKDKATLMSTMLKEIGVDSYYIIINTHRGAVNSSTPAVNWFNHAILAIKLPPQTSDSDVKAVFQHKTLGRLLIFDPTDEMTPFGYLRGALQANYGLLVADSGGELIELPKLAPSMNGTRRTAKLTLALNGTLTGDVNEIRMGDHAANERYALRSAATEKDKVKPIESVLSESLSNYRLTHATVSNLVHTDQPFLYDYSLVADNYGKTAGNLLLVRPRVLGSRTSALLETKEPRKYPVEFQGPTLDSDSFEIAIPPGYEISDLPPAVDVDYDFASYHSKTEAKGNELVYTRRFEVKELTVPVAQLETLKKFYRIIASDERNTAVLQPKSN